MFGVKHGVVAAGRWSFVLLPEHYERTWLVPSSALQTQSSSQQPCLHGWLRGCECKSGTQPPRINTMWASPSQSVIWVVQKRIHTWYTYLVTSFLLEGLLELFSKEGLGVE